jgi:pyruvate oxidase
VAVFGEISRTVGLLFEQIDSIKHNKINHENEIANRWEIWKTEKQKRLLENRDEGVSSVAVFDALTKTAPENAVMCVDVGNDAYSFGRYFESKNHTFLMSGYLGSIGFAFPAAMGAWAAVGEDRPIIAVAGDGGFCQYLAEMTTAVKYNMPIKTIILNNNELGKISKEQRAGGWDKWATDLVNPNFAEYAENCGALGIRVTDKNNLEKAMIRLFNHKGPGLIEVYTDVKLI